MRNWSAQLFFLWVIATPCLGQQASVNVRADAGPLRDARPFGKYLVEICTFSGEQRTLSCERPPFPGDLPAPAGGWQSLPESRKKDQSVTLKLVCDPDVKTACKLANPYVGGDFFVSATADSGLPVQQTVVLGSATPLAGQRTVHYRANAPGPIIIRGTAPATALFAASAPVDLMLQVSADAASASESCAVLPPSMGTQSTTLEASAIVSLLGNPTPFILTAQGPNTIVIYSTRQPLRGVERAILLSFQRAIAELAVRTPASLGISPAGKPFSVELEIPHAGALGDLATRIGGLNYSQFTAQDVDRNRVRVTAASQPECEMWKNFLTDIRGMAWRLTSEPMSKKLYYLSSSDVATAFSGLGSASAASAPAAATAAAIPSAAASSTPASTSSNATIAVTQPPGSNVQISSDTTPCVVAGLASGNASACGSAPATTASGASSAAAAAAPAPKPALGMSSVAVAAGTGEQTPPDLLLYSDSNPGDDAQVEERNRVIAQLDLPRPEMILSAWVTQNSSASPQTIGAFNNLVRSMIADYDHQFEAVVLRGWESVQAQSAQQEYFDEAFRSYIEDRFVADTYEESKPGKSAQELSQAFLDRSQAVLVDPPTMKRSGLGICPRHRYCLGYNSLFHPLKPALTDLLLTIIAARNPRLAADNAVTYVEGPVPPAASEAVCDVPDTEVRRRCHAIWRNLDFDRVSPPPGLPNCAVRDFRGILGSLLASGEPRVHLQCFRQEADTLFNPAQGNRPYIPGLLRAALADFLFNYKMSQQYPHEFASYDLSQSADALNNALSPLIDAFNRDLWSYQLFVRADMQYRVERLNSTTDQRCCVKRLFGLDKPSFFNDGIVTVRTISGQPTSVNTVSQSFLNASNAPQLSALLSSLAGSSANTTTAAPPSGAFPLASYPALVAALSNYQTTFAQIGRQLYFSATPRSLATASSAEIAVTLNADESANSPAYTGGGTSDPSVNTSRVATHETTTRVRVDSIKLFEVSSFSAIVERSHSRFPLLPPFVEIPYIGTFAGIPLGSAKEFHSSTAIIAAYVIPTATDIAFGLRFVSDLVVDGLNPGPCSFYKGTAGPDVTDACVFRRALSLRDFNPRPIREFNKNITRCFADETLKKSCESVSFDRAIKVQ